MIKITYRSTTQTTLLGVYSPADTLRFLSNLQYTPTFIYVRESGITIVP